MAGDERERIIQKVLDDYWDEENVGHADYGRPSLAKRIAEALKGDLDALAAAREENGRLDLVLTQVRQALRTECAEVDANDWPNDLHPADVIEKHLVRAWQDKNGRLREALEHVVSDEPFVPHDLFEVARATLAREDGG